MSIYRGIGDTQYMHILFAYNVAVPFYMLITTWTWDVYATFYSYGVT